MADTTAVIDPSTQLAQIILKETLALFNEPLTHLNILRFVGAAMTVVERYSGLPGLMKKQIVIMTVNLAIDEITPDDSEYELLVPFAKYFIGHTIDQIVEVNNGGLKLNTTKNPVIAFFAGLKNRLKTRCLPGATASST